MHGECTDTMRRAARTKHALRSLINTISFLKSRKKEEKEKKKIRKFFQKKELDPLMPLPRSTVIRRRYCDISRTREESCDN